MRLGHLIAAAERRLKRVEQALAFDILADEARRADKRRYRALSKVPVHEYIAAGEEIEIHRSLMPKKNSWEDGAPYPWAEWTRLTVDRIGPDCLRVFVPQRGSLPIPVGDFVRGVLKGYAREAGECPY